MTARFELYKDARSEYRWRLRSPDSRDYPGRHPKRVADPYVIATSPHGFTSKGGALNCIEAVKRDAAGAEVVDRTDRVDFLSQRRDRYEDEP